MSREDHFGRHFHLVLVLVDGQLNFLKNVSVRSEKMLRGIPVASAIIVLTRLTP